MSKVLQGRTLNGLGVSFIGHVSGQVPEFISAVPSWSSLMFLRESSDATSDSLLSPSPQLQCIVFVLLSCSCFRCLEEIRFPLQCQRCLFDRVFHVLQPHRMNDGTAASYNINCVLVLFKEFSFTGACL